MVSTALHRQLAGSDTIPALAQNQIHSVEHSRLDPTQTFVGLSEGGRTLLSAMDGGLGKPAIRKQLWASDKAGLRILIS